MTNDISRLNYSGEKPTPTMIINELMSRLPTMEEIYVVAKDKNGNSSEYLCGNVGGLTFAILILQKHAMKALP